MENQILSKLTNLRANYEEVRLEFSLDYSDEDTVEKLTDSLARQMIL